MIIDDLILQTEKHRNYYSIRDINTWLSWEVDVWREGNTLYCSAKSDCDDTRADQLANSSYFRGLCASAVNQDYPEDFASDDEYDVQDVLDGIISQPELKIDGLEEDESAYTERQWQHNCTVAIRQSPSDWFTFA